MSDRNGRVKASFDATAAARRVESADKRAGKLVEDGGDRAAADEIRAKADSSVQRRIDEMGKAAAETSAAMPNAFRAVKGSFRIERAATPPGYNSAPAWVVRFDGNSPIARLARPARVGDPAPLDALHVRAASKLVRLHDRAVKPPAITASYDGPRAVSVGESCWIDVGCDAWAEMNAGLKALLPVERRVVLEVVVYDTPVSVLARSGLVPIAKPIRAEAAIVQTVRLGLERLSFVWGLDAGAPRDVVN